MGSKSEVDSEDFRNALAKCVPELWKELSALVEDWTKPVLDRLSQTRTGGSYPKTFNDPVWGVIELYPWETLILDSPLLQRLRGIRQLGMAHLVYPGAGHNRLDHTRGVVEAAARMIQALEKNADYRRRFGKDRDAHVPEVASLDRVSIRLAALLHDIGHAPFSHATEDLVQQCFESEFIQAESLIQDTFDGVSKVSTSEIVAICMIMSESMQQVFSHERFGAEVTPVELPAAICARIAGSRSNLSAGYLSGVINGPIDADKLDYMSRDCHHAGLPLGQDITRLISKLEVVTITPENAPNKRLRERAQHAPYKRFYEIGISQTGLGAYEQMIIGRVFLYDRLYYHHKVRSAEAMVRSLIDVAIEERGVRYSLRELFSEHNDDAMLALIGGSIRSDDVPSGNSRAKSLSQDILRRRIYYRGYAFAARFIAGLESLEKEEQDETRMLIWRRVLKDLNDKQQKKQLAEAIYELALELCGCIDTFSGYKDELLPEHILVDLPLNKVAVRGGDILTRTDSGHVGPPNLFFDPERWSQAYEHQKHCGFVFTPRRYVALVSLASKIVFYERYGLVASEAADRASKTTRQGITEWIEIAYQQELCSAECSELLQQTKPRFALFHEEDLLFPESWTNEDPELAQRLTQQMNEALPTGLPASFHQSVVKTIQDICIFVDILEKGGDLDGIEHLKERDFQQRLRNHLRSREVSVMEGANYGGGETDLILHDRIVVENKVRESTEKPFEVGPHYKWQERRYSLAISSRVGVVVLAYRPSSEKAILPLPKRIQIAGTPDYSESRAQIRVVIPWGRPRPSAAKSPHS